MAAADITDKDVLYDSTAASELLQDTEPTAECADREAQPSDTVPSPQTEAAESTKVSKEPKTTQESATSTHDAQKKTFDSSAHEPMKRQSTSQ